MDKDESPEAKQANMHFRKKEQARQGSEAWAEHLGREATTTRKTADLKAQRLARDAATLVESPPPAKAKVGRKAALKIKTK